jgi:hypothetical protein
MIERYTIKFGPAVSQKKAGEGSAPRRWFAARRIRRLTTEDNGAD